MKEGVNKIISSKSKTFLAFCFCFILGVSVFSGMDLEKYWLFRLYILLFTAGFLIIVFWPSKTSATPSNSPLVRGRSYIRFGLFCALFFILGGTRFMLSVTTVTENHIAYYNDSEMEFIGRVVQEPDVGIAGAKYVMGVSVVNSKQTTVNRIGGKVLINAPLYPQYKFGEVLKIKCKLQAPKNADDSTFNYEKYLAKDGIFSVCFRPVIVILSETKNPLNNGEKGSFAGTQDDSWRARSDDSSDRSFDFAPPFAKGGASFRMTSLPLRYIFFLKSKINTQVEKLWPEPQSSLMAGLLYGARAGLPSELKENFSRVGITHIIAISGYNISIIASVLMTILISAGLYRRQAFWACVSGIILFVIFTGASASVMRAGIMGIIVLTAQQLGRLSRMGNVLAITAALMLLMNPYILIWDAGFQLSFLATMGLVYLSPVIESTLFGRDRSRPVPTVIFETFFSTLSAIIITLPLILFQFGRLSIVAPVVNVLVLWIIPWLMLFGFIAVMLSFVICPVGQVVAWMAGIGLKYVIILTQWFGGLAWASVDIRVGVWAMVGMYVALALVMIKFKSQK